MSKLHLLVAAGLILAVLPSCRKVYDYIHDHPEAYRTPCRITNYRVVAVNGVHTNYIVSYNNKGNPVTMMDSDRVSPIGLDHYFRYDQWDRLTDHMQAGPLFGAMVWHKYQYVRPDYIMDTVMFYETGDVRGPSPIAKYTTEYRINAYTLDSYGRIWKVWDIPNDPPNTPSLNSLMVYDAKGNLPSPDSLLTYDNKVNLFRTNKVWQFVYNNYSANNLVLLDGLYPPQYNAYGLPLTLRNLERWYIYPFWRENYSREAYVEYACPIQKGPIDY